MPLEAYATVIQGQSPPGSAYNSEGQGIPFFQGKAEFGDLYPTVEKWCTEPTKLAAKDDVLISIRAPVGPTNLCPEMACIGRGLAALRSPAGAPPKYLLYAMRNSADSLAAKATGSTFTAISGAELRQHPIPVAPIAEQRRIVEAIESHFTQLDSAASALTRVRANLRRYRGSVLKAACDGGLSNGKPFPTVPFGDVCESMKNGIYRPSDVYADDGSGTACLRMYNIEPARLVWKDIKRMRLSREEILEYGLEPGDLLINRVNSRGIVGKAVAIPNGLEPVVFESKNIRARLKSDLDARYAAFVFAAYGLTYFSRNAQQVVGMASINQGQVADLPIPLPSRAEQERLVAEVERRLSVADTLTSEVETGLKRCSRLRRAILRKAFEGRLLPQDSNDQPAESAVQAQSAPSVPRTRGGRRA